MFKARRTQKNRKTRLLTVGLSIAMLFSASGLNLLEVSAEEIYAQTEETDAFGAVQPVDAVTPSDVNDTKDSQTQQVATEKAADDSVNTDSAATAGMQAPVSVETNSAAMIGEKEFDTLSEAIANAESGDTVLLYKDITESVEITGKTITIDMQGHSITGAGNTPAMKVKGNADLTLMNGSLQDTKTSVAGSGIQIQNSKANVQNLKIMNNSSHSGGAIYMTGGTLTGDHVIIENNQAQKDGGGIYLATANDSLSLTNSLIKGNQGASGGGIYAKKGTITLDNCTVEENTANNSYGGGIYTNGSSLTITGGSIMKNKTGTTGGGIYINSGAVSMKNLSIEENSANMSGGLQLNYSKSAELDHVTFKSNSAKASYGAISVNGSATAPAELTDCTFEKNVTLRSDILYSSSPLNLEKCIFSENSVQEGAILKQNGYKKDIVVTNCVFTKNTAETATINMNSGGKMMLSNTVIKNNTATGTADAAAGGVAITSSTGVLNIGEGCAIYNNTTASPKGSSDLYIKANADVDIAKASAMKDGEQDFTEYKWYDDENLICESAALTKSDKDRYFTAGEHDDFYEICKIGDKSYFTLQSALDDAEKDDTIVLTAGDKDNPRMVRTKSLTINKAVTIDMNGRTIQTSGDGLIVAQAGMLTLTGKGEIKGKLSVSEEGKIHLGKDIKIESLSERTGGTVSLDSAFNNQGAALTVYLDEEVIKKMNGNAGFGEKAALFTGCTDEELLKQIAVSGITSKLVKKVIDGNQIILQKCEAFAGVFLDGVSGNDGNTGFTVTEPVKTLEKAKEVLAANPDLDTIYISGTVVLQENCTLSLEKGKLMRYPDFSGNLISVPEGKTLTLKKVTIDGASSYGRNNADAMLHIEGTLEIEQDAVLENNENYAGRLGFGGAVYAGENSRIIMNGGVIRNCAATYGGGICLQYSSVFTMNDGVFEENRSRSYTGSGNAGSGGAVSISHNAEMIMNGGTFRANAAENGTGGAVSVGGFVYQGAKPKLTVNGGTFEQNSSNGCGGAIYVEVDAVATVNEAAKTNPVIWFKNNQASISSASRHLYGGGAIYVNGGMQKSGYANGRLYLYNAAIYGNTAVNGGAGFAGCGTSDTKIYLTDGGVIYGNTMTNQKASDILCDTIDHQSGMPMPYDPNTPAPKTKISEYMLGGGAYHWINGNDDIELPLDRLRKSGAKNIYTKLTGESEEITKAMNLAGVIITENTSHKKGGGIGSNGDVIIGRPNPEEEQTQIRVKKIWNDNNDSKGKRAEFVKIWLLQNGEKVSYQLIQPDENGIWPEIFFDEQPIANAEGNPYTYTVEEDMENIDKVYVSSVKEENGAQIVTNSYKPVVIIPDEPVPDEPTPPDDPIIIPDPKPPLDPDPGIDDPIIDDPEVPLSPGKTDETDEKTSVKNPKTGDNSSVSLWMMLLAAAGSGLVCLVRGQKRRREDA